jgi:hypothetical protein
MLDAYVHTYMYMHMLHVLPRAEPPPARAGVDFSTPGIKRVPSGDEYLSFSLFVRAQLYLIRVFGLARGCAIAG